MSERRSSFGYEDLLACGREELFGPGNAQLPLPPMLMFDRITEIFETGGAFEKGYMRAELDVSPNLCFLIVILRAIRSCRDVLVLTPYGRCVGFFLAGLINQEEVARLALARSNFQIRCCQASRK